MFTSITAAAASVFPASINGRPQQIQLRFLLQRGILPLPKAVQEAHILNIPLIGICDTNCDPEELTYVIPGNDDAIRAVKLIVSKMADAVIEANQGQMEADPSEIPAEGYVAYPDEEA